jgi:hypothetical protein
MDFPPSFIFDKFERDRVQFSAYPALCQALVTELALKGAVFLEVIESFSNRGVVML